MLPFSPNDLGRMLQQLGISPQQAVQAMANPSALLSLMKGMPNSSSDPDWIIAQIKQAKATFEEDKKMPETPYQSVSRFMLLSGFAEARQKALKRVETLPENGVEMRTSYLGMATRASSTAYSLLTRVSLSEMYIRRTHIGQFILCRIISPANRIVATMFAVEDPNGDVCQVSLYNYPGAIGADPRTLDALFPLGGILLIREPTLKMANQGFIPHLRVDAPSDVQHLETDHPVLKDVTWKSGPLPMAAVLPSSEDSWKQLGNNYFKSTMYIPAALAYSRGLHRYPRSLLLRLNRAMAYLRLNNHGAALSDCNIVLGSSDLSQALRAKALFRAAEANYGLARWASAIELFESVAAHYDEHAAACKIWIERSKDRKSEASHGRYALMKMYQESRKPGHRFDVADYTGPVEVATITTRGGGRGVIASPDVKFGELLVVSKAYASATPLDCPPKEQYSLLNLITNTFDVGCDLLLGTKIAERFAGDPGSAKLLLDLYAGPDQPPPPSQYHPITLSERPVENFLDFEVDVDISRIEAILSYNRFGTGKGGKTGEPDPFMASVGIFTLPSLFNHSCSPNASWTCWGDIMIIRASHDIPKGHEIFLSYVDGTVPYDERSKKLKRWFDRCDCPLCTADRADGQESYRKRDQIISQQRQRDVATCTVSSTRKAISELHKTYKTTRRAPKVDLFDAVTRCGRIAQDSGDPLSAVQETFEALECVGIAVLDKSTQGATGRGHLPIAQQLASPIPTAVLIGAVETCMGLAGIFQQNFFDEKRTERWGDAAIYLHDKLYGGGKDLFRLMMKTDLEE